MILFGAALVSLLWLLSKIPRGPVQVFEGALIAPAVDMQFAWPAECAIWIEDANANKRRFRIPSIQARAAIQRGMQADPDGPAMHVRLHFQKNYLKGYGLIYLEILQEGWISRPK